MKRIISLILVFALIAAVPTASMAGAYDYVPVLAEYSSSFVQRLNEWPEHESEADALHHLGLFKGADNGFELSRTPTRIEALVTVIRLIGCEAEALALNSVSTFTDVPDWAAAYAGYGQQHGIVQGIGNNLLGASDPVSAPQYITMLLRVLGYDDSVGDFEYSDAIAFAESIALLTPQGAAHFAKDESMVRGDMAYLMYSALGMETKAGGLLILNLVDSGAVNEASAFGTMLDRDEPQTEIYRALANGYSEVWLQQFCDIIDSNSRISSIFAPTFKQSMYNWLKEAGSSGSIAQMKHYLSLLTTNIVRPSSDAMFKNSPEVAAYFMYPNQVVVRSDLDIGFEGSAISHELRHAMSASMGILTLEEGMTELFNQEVDGGHYGYSYYYVNTAKLFTHLIGAKRMNEIIYSGTYEDVFYELELLTGVKIDKNTFRTIIYNISETAAREQSYRTFMEIMSELIYAYYMKNNAELIAQSGGYERYIDTLIALAQLLYFPSAMVRDAETNIYANLPSTYYSADFEASIAAILSDHAAITGEAADVLESYYREHRDTRYCLKYFGPDSGKVMIKNADATRVTYKDRNTYYDKTFGRDDEAIAFEGKVKVTKTEVVSGAGFTEKMY